MLDRLPVILLLANAENRIHDAIEYLGHSTIVIEMCECQSAENEPKKQQVQISNQVVQTLIYRVAAEFHGPVRGIHKPKYRKIGRRAAKKQITIRTRIAAFHLSLSDPVGTPAASIITEM